MQQRLNVLLIALAVLGAIAVRELRDRWTTPLVISEPGYVVTVAPGDSLRTIADTLHQAGVLLYPHLLKVYGRWTGLDQQIQPGEYLLRKNATPESLLRLLKSGDVIQYQVTFPEGITLTDALDILAQQDPLTKTLAGASDPRILEIVKPHSHPEGLFFPDTYHYARNDTDWSILHRSHSRMNAVLWEEWEQRTSPLPYQTPYDALIMASIVERETGIPEERAQISGVFVRRLQKGMPLQTDPTVIYGLGIGFDGNLQRRHLMEEGNSYNTYRHTGLPPTPIALPGRAAIHAALHPAAGNSIYFVARGDGGHVFSDSLDEHNQAVREHQLHPSENYTSTPKRTD